MNAKYCQKLYGKFKGYCTTDWEIEWDIFFLQGGDTGLRLRHWRYACANKVGELAWPSSPSWVVWLHWNQRSASDRSH